MPHDSNPSKKTKSGGVMWAAPGSVGLGDAATIGPSPDGPGPPALGGFQEMGVLTEGVLIHMGK